MIAKESIAIERAVVGNNFDTLKKEIRGREKKGRKCVSGARVEEVTKAGAGVLNGGNKQESSGRLAGSRLVRSA